MPSHYKDPISTEPDHVGGVSRKARDTSNETKITVISKIISYGTEYGLSNKDIANLIAFAKIESGFNPDAAAQGDHTSASGVFQITDRTAKDATKRLNGTSRVNGIDAGEFDRFDLDSNIKFGIKVYLDKKIRAKSDNAYDIYKVWYTDPDEYTKYKDQLDHDSKNFEINLKENKKFVDFISRSGYATETTVADAEYDYSEGNQTVKISYKYTMANGEAISSYEDYDSANDRLVSMKQITINEKYVETRIDQTSPATGETTFSPAARAATR